MTKVFILGLDGGTFDYMDPWLDAGDLPNLARLIEQGTRGVLRSTYLPVTALAWPSMLTGRNPGKHGIFDFRTRRPGSYELRPASMGDCGASPLHVHLSQIGRRVGMLGVPLTYPPEPVNGILVSDFTTPEGTSDWSWPPGLAGELDRAGIPYPIERLHELMRMEKARRAFHEIERFVEGWKCFREAQVEVVGYLLERTDYDFFMVVFSETDHINHHTPDRDAIRRVYQGVDEAIGRIVEMLDRDTAVLVVSDHGSAPLERFVVLHRLLSDLGLLAFRPEVSPRYLRLLTSRVARRWQHALPRLWSRLSPPLRRWMSRPLLQFEERLSHDYVTIDWKRTRAYVRSGIGAIYLNVAGREPEGIVSPGSEYEALRDRIRQELLTLRDPDTGERPIAEALRGEGVFHGPYMADAPDIVLSFGNSSYRAMPGFATDPVVRPANRKERSYNEFGYHTPEGILIAAGPGLKAGGRIEGARVEDIAPTVLHLMGLPVPSDMDGRVLLGSFERPSPVRYAPAAAVDGQAGTSDLTIEEEEEIAARLRALGYLD